MTGQMLVAGSILAVMTAYGNVTINPQRARDETEIRGLQVRQAEAWNRHDATAYAALFAEDGDVVNVVGWWWRGRKEIERQLTAAYAVVFRESKLTIVEVQVRFVANDLAIAHVRWSMEGARPQPPIPEPRAGIQMQVLQKRGGVWRIEAFQNTNSLAETAFPIPPSS